LLDKALKNTFSVQERIWVTEQILHGGEDLHGSARL